MSDAATIDLLPASVNSLRVERQSLRRLVEDRLRAAIIEGAFPPGSHLADRALCEQFGCSRSIIREAIRLLEAEGLVTVAPHRGPFVTFLTAAEAVQIYEVRAALEALAGQGFAERASDEERAALRRVYEELAVMDATVGQHALLEAKRAFYDVLLRGCRNDYVGRMLGQLLNRITRLRATSLSSPGRLPNTVRELRRILGAIDQRDGEGAAAACREHVRAAATVALAVLRERERAAQHSRDS
ncbi:MAG TPA: GntR family transcriptional regulator [Acetobacteraceae bacterium]|nr:GntR family transcriptional regulator [Acetobacteraceae bacterium]